MKKICRFKLSKAHVLLFAWIGVCAVSAWGAVARDKAAAAAAATGTTSEEKPPPRPARLPDLTKGEQLPPPGKHGPVTWAMGPSGVIGIMCGGESGDQIRVINVVPGSPAEGIVLPGDVILGVGGQDFKIDGHMGFLAGNAIIKAEEEAAKGALDVHLWRDRNWVKRTAAKDVFGVDVEELFKEAEEGAALYEWMGEEERTVSVEQMGYDEFPMDPIDTNVVIQLEVMGTYSDTTPYDCPVVAKVRENAWQVLADRMTKPDKRGRLRGDWPSVLALVASGKPEYMKVARNWVHNSRRRLCRDMDAQPSLDDMSYKGMQSWRHGFNALELAIYYDATHDEFVLPELRYRAILTALGQNGGGSWGHTFSFPERNGGLLHKNNPGYGAMNNAGTRCFFLLTLAKKAGIEHPEINQAIERASRFFGTFVDKGCIPYGYHAPWPSDDSNGKNYGATYAFYTMGKYYEAKYFAMHSAHASFSRRGGHGSPTLWYYTPLSQNVAGPRAVKASMRNMRWFYTLSRRHDGSFIFLGDQAPGIGGKGMRNPTATVALHLSAPLKELVITGKDADKDFWLTDEEHEELLVSARGQVKYPDYRREIGKSFVERDTDELIGFLDHFYPNARGHIAKELAKRYAGGEKDIPAKLLLMLKSDEDRMRDGACRALSACDAELVLANLSEVIALLDDDAEFVRMTAAKTIGKATAPGVRQRELTLLKSISEDYPGKSMDNGNMVSAIKGVLFPRRRRGQSPGDTKLLTDPFDAGYDQETVMAALETLVTADPGGIVPGGWSQETLLKLAGHVAFSAEVRQVNDAMFGGARKQQAQALLRKYGYREAIEGDAANLFHRLSLDRKMRIRVNYKDPYLTPKTVKKDPGAYTAMLEPLKRMYLDRPLFRFSEKLGPKGAPPVITPILDLIELIAAATPSPLESVGLDVKAMFDEKLSGIEGKAAKIDFCRKALEDVAHKNYFWKMAAMRALSGLVSPDSMMDALAPYFGHEHWRVRAFVDTMATDLLRREGADRLLERVKVARGAPAAGMLNVIAKARITDARPTIVDRLDDDNPDVRVAAVKALAAVGREKDLPELYAVMKAADERTDLWGCELALVSFKDDASLTRRICKDLQGLLVDATEALRGSIYWVLAQLGDDDVVAFLRRAGEDTANKTALRQLAMALSFSPRRSADRAMVGIARESDHHASIMGAQAYRRLAIGPEGINTVSDKDKMDFAEPMLRLNRNPNLIRSLGRIRTARSLNMLLECMKIGPPDVPAQAIVDAAEDMEFSPRKDKDAAVNALKNVIEFIEVTQLRGGVKGKDWRTYPKWKALQARAGKAMLKVYDAKPDPLQGLDDMEMDLDF